MTDNEEFADAGQKYTKSMNDRQDSFKEEARTQPHQFDQDLGIYKSGSKFVKIMCRDPKEVDGDKVRILVNDEVVLSEITLSGEYRGLNLDLVKGFNKISFQALNQGSSGPNTAEFVVYDDTGTIVLAKEWDILTGVKATFIVVKE